MLTKASLTVAAYAALLGVSGYVYFSYPQHQSDIQFWIPQIYLLILITVTTLYVIYTANLVEETKNLQLRPMLRITFIEIPEPSALQMSDLCVFSRDRAQGVVARVVGGDQLQAQPRWLAIELKNIGQSTVRSMTMTVTVTLPGESETEERKFSDDIPADENIQITVAPASLPYVKIRVQSLVYGEGLRRYTNFDGEPLYETNLGSPSLSRVVK